MIWSGTTAAGRGGAMSRNVRVKSSAVLLLLGLLVSEGGFLEARSESQRSIFVRASPISVSSSSTPWVPCRTNASICKDPNKNPDLLATTCCGKRVCKDLQRDAANCGSCSRVCRIGGGCCSGECVDLHRDPNNCGNCNNACHKTTVCSFGMCGYAGG